MLKKKNIAMTMAVATVATTVAPAFAATLDGETISVKDTAKVEELKSEIKGYFATKYSKNSEDLKESDNAGKSVYTVKVGANKDSLEEIKTLDALEVELAKITEENPTLLITVEDKGHKTVDGITVDWKEGTYKKAELEDLLTIGENVTDTNKLDDNTVSLTLKNNETPLVIKTGDVKIDTTAPIYLEDSVGSKLDKDGNGTTDEDEFVVIGFKKEKVELQKDDTKVDYDLEEKRTFTVKYDEIETTDLKASDLYNFDIGRLEKQGNELVKYIAKYNEAKDLEGNLTNASIIKDGNTIKITFVEKKNTPATTVKISGSTKEITTLYKILNNEETPKVTTLAGLDRFETAIEVSKDAFEDKKATNIVLVAGNSIADGLAATPFAKQENAPVLLTGTDKVSDNTMDEIERVLANKETGKVYLVGGESNISKKVETQLKAKGLKIERIAGEDRFETSLEIAKKMTKTNSTDEIFIAGGYAQADAMSIAAVAAKGGAEETDANPILLVPTTGLTKDQTKFVKNLETTKAYVVGGETSVSADVEIALEKMPTVSVKRISGVDRQETNAKVVKEFYAKDSFDTVYVAKSDNNSLVDALAVGVAAASETKAAPVLLATDSLSSSQESVLKGIANGKLEAEKQAGYGIAAQVWETLNKIFK